LDINQNNFCIVGFGNHAKTKLLPALEKSNKNIFGIVSSKTYLRTNIKIFKSLQEAINASNKNTIFVISSPPKQHFCQMKLILNANRNVYVEKPIFVNSKEAKFFKNFLKEKKLIAVELLMYKYTKQYKNFIKIWNLNKDKYIKIECYFNIPETPLNTFRDNNDIISSPLYDIGCYVLSLLVDLKISLKNIKIFDVVIEKNKFVKFYLVGFFKQLEIYLEFGVEKEYKNLVRLSDSKDINVEFNKFFYGRKSDKDIVYKGKNIFKRKVINDYDGFENIFNYPRSFWLANQNKRFENIIKVNNKLISLTESLIVPK
jgi:hypothetical protein